MGKLLQNILKIENVDEDLLKFWVKLENLLNKWGDSWEKKTSRILRIFF